MKPHLGKSCLLFLLLCGVTSTLIAQEDTPLKAIPNDYHVIVRLHTPQPTVTRVSKLANEISEGSGALLELMFSQANTYFGLPSMETVDSAADWWMVVKLNADAPPSLVYILPGKSKNPKLMQDKFEDGVTFVQFRQWNIFSQEEELIKQIGKRIKGEGTSITSLIDRDDLAVLDRGDLSAWVNLNGIKKLYAGQIGMARGAMDAGMKMALEQVDKNPATQNQPSARLGMELSVNTIFPAIWQFIDDATSVSANIVTGRTGVAIEKVLTVKPGSPTAKNLASQTTSDMKGLGQLPSSHLAFCGVSGNTQAFMDWALKFSATTMTDPAMKKILDDYSAEFAKMKFGAITMSFNPGKPEEGLLQAVTLMEVDNIPRMRELTRKGAIQMKAFSQAGVKATVDFKPDAEKYGSLSADLQTTKVEIDKSNPAAAAQEQILQSMYGPNGASVRTLYLKNYVMQVIGGKDVATAAVMAYEGKVPAVKKPAAKPGTPTSAKKNTRNTLQDGEVRRSKGAGDAADPVKDEPEEAKTDSEETPVRIGVTALKQTRARLSPKANLILLVDLPILISRTVTAATENTPFGAMIPEPIKELGSEDAKPSFTGLSLAAEDNSIRFRLVLPMEQLQALGKAASALTPPPPPATPATPPVAEKGKTDAPMTPDKPADPKTPDGAKKDPAITLPP